MLNVEAYEWQQFKNHCLGKLFEHCCRCKPMWIQWYLLEERRKEEFKMVSWEGGTASSKYWLLMEQKVEQGENSPPPPPQGPFPYILLHVLCFCFTYTYMRRMLWCLTRHPFMMLLFSESRKQYLFPCLDFWRKNSPVICFIVVQVSLPPLCNLFVSL